MTNKEILQANLLDIIFENRNKEYGAYTLRINYEKRLVKALSIGLGAALLFILLNFLKFNNSSSSHSKKDKDELTLTTYEVQPDKPKEPEPPRVEKTVAQVDYQNIKVVPDPEVTEKLPDADEIDKNAISNKNVDGEPDDKFRTNDLTSTPNNGAGEIKAPEPEKVIKIVQRAPQYPGGLEALTEFMRRNLVTPEEIEIGVKKIVRVKFIVGVDGSITDVTILESPGRIYDKEVTRVIKKMPKWEPAIQNDMNVAISYILPVTFISEEY